MNKEKKYTVRKTREAMLHKIAHCRDCDWQEEGYRVASRLALKHARKHGHHIDVETGMWYEIITKK